MTAASNIRSVDMLFLDDLFEMGGGYVLNFSDRTIAQFFAEELNIDFDDPLYAKHGTSKAKRLRCLLQTVDKPTVVRTLNALWEYRETLRLRAGTEEKIQNAQGRFLALIEKISGGTEKAPSGQTPPPAFDRALFAELLAEFQQLSQLAPQPRGYAFEAFLIKLFNEFGLEAREPFRLRGEQIDGSFVLGNEIYLLEGKWQNAPSAIDHLHTFHGKIEQKAAWTRGLIISYSGFSEDGLNAFGRGKRVVCMDGLDIYEMLNRELPLAHLLERKVRRAGETGSAFVRIRELFP
jgi:Restriction endonuclease